MDFLDYKLLYGNSVLDLIVFFLIIFVAYLIGRIVRYIADNWLPKLTAKTKTKLDDVLISVLKAPTLFAIMLVGIWIAFNRIEIPEKAYAVLSTSYRFLIAVSFTWFISRAVGTAINVLGKQKVDDESSSLDNHVLTMINRAASCLIWSIGAITALNNAGVDVGALIAGLGIGGVAIALAAQDTAKNIFGGAMILFDKPFKMGDLIEIDGITGYVEDIGIRSIKVRTYAGQLVVIPNYKTADSNLVNISREPSRRIELNVGLTYDTTPQQMREAMEILKELPKKVEGIEAKTKVYFTSFGESSLNITCWYYIKKGSDLFDTQSRVNLYVLDEYNAKGLNFAFPTRTVVVENK